MGHHQLSEQVGVEVRLADGVHDRRRVEPEVHEDAHVAELEVGVDERRAALQPAGQGDGGVDRHGRGAHAALGAVEAAQAAERRPSRRPASASARRPERASSALMRAISSSGWNGLTMSSSAPARRPRTRCSTSASAVSMMIGMCWPGRLGGADALRRGIAVQLRHGHVHQDQVGLHAGRQLDAGFAVGGDVHLEPFLLQGEDEDALDVQVVIDDQDLGGSHKETLETGRNERDYRGWTRCFHAPMVLVSPGGAPGNRARDAGTRPVRRRTPRRGPRHRRP